LPLITDYHAQYFAHELTRRCPVDSVEKLAGALVDAQVDLNPHQVDAALFAFQSPLSKGALLADEVGLGKTIEAGLVLSQKWAERKRRILIITPSNLRKQWYQEMAEKFFLPCRILEAKSYNAAIKQGQFRPFEAPEIVICSYQFAKSKAGDVHAVPWDLVVIDEAHRLRNVYKPANVIANTLKLALAGKHKLLLTATPLQNSLLELFTELKPSAYTCTAQEPPADYRIAPADKSNMAKYLFGGFERCLYPVQKFDSDSERKLAVILERDTIKWFKPAKGQFQIYYRQGADHLEYQPDFVAETADMIYMLEPKASNQMDDPVVLAKQEAAINWCVNASDHAAKNGGKPWYYLLIPHDEIAGNMTLDGLAKRFSDVGFDR